MKITRHTAADMRQALRAVREQLGDEAVILSSRRTAQGVEVTAAVDFDAARLEAAAAYPPEAPPVTSQPVAEEMGSELKTLRRMLETQLAQLTWNERTRRHPVHT